MVQFLKQSTAATVKWGPFVDDSDGKTAETALTIQKADVRVSKNGGDYAAANADQGASDAGAPHDELGDYDGSLDTTDTGTPGRLRVRIAKSGSLPVWHDYMVVPANVYDSLIAGSDKLQADTVEWNSVALSATNPLPNAAPAASGGLATVDGSNRVAGIQGTITTLDALDTAQDAQHAVTQGRLPASLAGGRIDASIGAVANGAITANAFASGAIDAVALDTTAVAEIADGVLDEAIAEPAGVFSWPGSLRGIVGFLGALGRNKITQTASTFTLRNDADSGSVATAGVSDDGTTFTRDTLS